MIKIGDKFDRWIVLADLGSDGKNHYFQVRCQCGTERKVRGWCLVSTESRSCGCLIIERSYKHGCARLRTYNRTYNIWSKLKRRCSDPKDPTYSYYGGRGIKVCNRWSNFINFLADMGECPEGLTLERKDNNGDYSPENCRWATRKDQSNNRRSNKLIEYKGSIRNITQWAEHLGLRSGTLWWRLQNWSVERSLEEVLR